MNNSPLIYLKAVLLLCIVALPRRAVFTDTRAFMRICTPPRRCYYSDLPENLILLLRLFRLLNISNTACLKKLETPQSFRQFEFFLK